MLKVNLQFITKRQLQEILKKLSTEQYIQQTQINNKYIYILQDHDLINNKIQNSSNQIANNILNINELNYYVTSLLYGVRDNHKSYIQIIYLIALCLLFQIPTTVFKYEKRKFIKKIEDNPKKNIKKYEDNAKKYIQKYRFIKNFLNNITNSFDTNTQTIHIDIIKNSSRYQQLLYSKLQLIEIQRKPNSLLTFQELIQIFNNNNNQEANPNISIRRNNNIQDIQVTAKVKQTKTFYTNESNLLNYVKKYYVF